MRRVAGVLAAGIITAASLTYALWGTDPRALWQTLIGGSPWVIPPFLLILAAFYYSNAQRWGLILRHFGHFSPRALMPSMMIGFAANNVLPLRAGELIRTFMLAKDYQLPRSGILMTLVLERLLDLIGILTVFVAGLLLVTDAPAAFRTSAWVAAAAILAIAAALSALLLLPDAANRLWRMIARPLPTPLLERGTIYLQQFGRALAPMRDPALTALVLLQSIGRWFLPVLLAWLCIHAYADRVSLPAAMITIGITAFAVALPSAPGFVGPIQAAFVFALTPFGISQEAALAASVAFLLGHWIPVTATGAALLASRHLSFKDVAAQAADNAAADEPGARNAS